MQCRNRGKRNDQESCEKASFFSSSWVLEWLFLYVFEKISSSLLMGYFQNLDPNPGRWKVWTLKNVDPEEPWPYSTWILKSWTMKNVRNNWTQEKDWKTTFINLPRLKICQEETCKLVIWKNSYWGFLGRQKIWVKMNSIAINK